MNLEELLWFYRWLNLVQVLGRIAWMFCSHILIIPIIAHGQRPNHHLHCSTSGQISSFDLSIWWNLWTWRDCLNILHLIINAPTWSPSPSHAHSSSQHALHSGLGLGLLVSRQRMMMAVSWVKLTRSSWIPQQAARARAQACMQGCCQAADHAVIKLLSVQ